MKTKILHFWRLGLLSLLGAAMLAACTDEEFVREAGDQPREGALTGTAAELIRPDRVDGTLRLLDKDVADHLLCRLSRPAAGSLTLRVVVDEAAVDAYNKEHETDFPLFPPEHLTLLTPATIAAGEQQSEPLLVQFERAQIEPGTYLLPLRAAIDEQSVQQDDAAMRFCYVVQVFEDREPATLDEWPFLTVGYINTQEMNPLYADGFFYVTEVNMGPPMVRKDKTWLDLITLRKSSITIDDLGRVSFLLEPDLAFVLNNREKYIVPLQRGGRKVLICINGCLRSLDDGQVAEAAYRIGKAVSDYGVDGVNFFDMGDSYQKAGAPSIIPSSYAKLIKATKEALGDKLVTIACDAGSTEELSVAQEGIEAGRYLDYAWSGIFDKVVDAYADNTELKPVAGLERAKYGGAMLQTHKDSWHNEHSNDIVEAIKNLLFSHPQSANIFAFWDMPTNQQGTEGGPMNAFRELTGAMRDTAKRLMYTVNTRGLGNYGAFVKDW